MWELSTFLFFKQFERSCILVSTHMHSGVAYFFSGKKVPVPLPQETEEPVRLRNAIVVIAWG